jgi:hypothetical protein
VAATTFEALADSGCKGRCGCWGSVLSRFGCCVADGWAAKGGKTGRMNEKNKGRFGSPK